MKNSNSITVVTQNSSLEIISKKVVATEQFGFNDADADSGNISDGYANSCGGFSSDNGSNYDGFGSDSGDEGGKVSLAQELKGLLSKSNTSANRKRSGTPLPIGVGFSSDEDN